LSAGNSKAGQLRWDGDLYARYFYVNDGLGQIMSWTWDAAADGTVDATTTNGLKGGANETRSELVISWISLRLQSPRLEGDRPSAQPAGTRYDGDVQPAHLRAYVQRAWDRVAALKRSRWQQRRERLGAAEGFRVAGELYEQVKRTRPDWPTRESRSSDREFHICLSAQLRAVRTRKPAH
jgi:hypothetical protein